MFHSNHDISYCPVDIPRYESHGEIERGFAPVFANVVGHHDRLTSSYSIDGLPYSEPRKWLPEAKEKFPRLIEYVDEYLPFSQVCFAKIIHSPKNLGFHIDIGKFDRADKKFYDYQYRNSPCAYRVILEGQYNDVLYYSAYSDLPREKWICSVLPEDTNAFVHGLDSIHGTLYDTRIKRFILFIHGWLDIPRHLDLLTRSRAKYAQHVITYDDLQRKANDHP